MNIDEQTAWIERFVISLSRWQVDTSSDLLVERTCSGWRTLRELLPDGAARPEGRVRPWNPDK